MPNRSSGNSMRIGVGYDIHRLKKGRRLVLGGIAIPSGKGLDGHSDADVLLHAVSDALLGAAGLGDIGMHFPDTDKRFKGISSVLILQRVCRMCGSGRYHIINIDCTLIAEAPKISKYREAMKRCISRITGTRNINIKATTNEGLGAVGRGEGIAAFAVALLENGRREKVDGLKFHKT